MRSKLESGMVVRVATKYGSRRVFNIRIVQAELGVRFLCALHNGRPIRGESLLWNSPACNDWLSNLESAA